MSKERKVSSQNQQRLTEIIIKGIEEVKGKEIVSLDLSAIPEAVTACFVICTGDSTTQVDAIADSVVKEVREAIGEKPWNSEGKETSQWVLLDFVDVVVHIFHKDARPFYGIEELWNDAPRTNHSA